MLKNMLNLKIKNTSQPFHWQESMIMFFVLRGEMQLVSGNRSEILTKGTIGLVNSGDVHCVEKQSDDLIYIQISLGSEHFERYMPGISTVYFKCTSEENDVISENLKSEIKGYIAAITKLMCKIERASNKEQQITYYCLQILNILKMRFTFVGKELNESKSQHKFDQLWKVVDYVYDNYMRKLTIQEVADHIFVSHSYLGRLIKEQTGLPFEKFLALVRSEASLKLLLESDKSITNIAYDVGFSAPRYYYTAFEANYGCSPAEYREKNQKHFLMQSGLGNSEVSYDEGVTREILKTLLGEYSMFEENADEGIRTIEIKLNEPIKDRGLLKYNLQTVVCSKADLIKHDFNSLMQQIRTELGVKYIKVDAVDEEISKLLQNKMNQYGLQLLSANEDAIGYSARFDELINDSGSRSQLYYLFGEISKVTKPYEIVNKHCVKYREGDAVKVLIFNLEENKEIDFSIDIPDAEAGVFYLCSMVYLRILTTEEREILNEASKNHDISGELEGIMKPEMYYEIHKPGMPFFEPVQFPGRGCATISCKKLK